MERTYVMESQEVIETGGEVARHINIYGDVTTISRRDASAILRNQRVKLVGVTSGDKTLYCYKYRWILKKLAQEELAVEMGANSGPMMAFCNAVMKHYTTSRSEFTSHYRTK